MEWFALYLFIVFVFVIEMILFGYLLIEKRKIDTIDKIEQRVDFLEDRINYGFKYIKYFERKIEKLENKGGE